MKKFLFIFICLFLLVGCSEKKQEEKVDDNASSNITSNDSSNEIESNGSFLMPVEDVFFISGEGVVVTGRIESGSVKIGDEVEIIGLSNETKKVKVSKIESFRKQMSEAKKDDNVGLLLTDITREDVARGQVIATPNSISAHTKFKAEIYALTKEEGGRQTAFFSNYRPQFYFRTTDVAGTIELPINVEMVKPGDTVTVTVELPESIAMNKGTEFTIREGSKTIGHGKVIEIIK